MINRSNLNHIFELNIAMLLISTSGALGRYIDMPVPLTIAYRALFGGIFIFIFCRFKKYEFNIKKKDFKTILASGILMGLHWITYFYALKLSNVAVGMLSLFTYPVITALIEPLIVKTKFQKIHLVLGILILIGIYFLVPDFNFENNNTKAVILGVISALCYSLRNIIMKLNIRSNNGSILMLYQLIVIVVFLSPTFLISNSSDIINQLPANLALALLTTAIGHTMFLYSFKYFSTTSISIISSTQPIYGIIIGMIFLKEYPEMGAILGGILILTSVFIESMRTYYKTQNAPS